MMHYRTDQQKLDDARRHAGRVEAQLRQRDKRIAELEAANERLRQACEAAVYADSIAEINAALDQMEAALRKTEGEGDDV